MDVQKQSFVYGAFGPVTHIQPRVIEVNCGEVVMQMFAGNGGPAEDGFRFSERQGRAFNRVARIDTLNAFCLVPVILDGLRN